MSPNALTQNVSSEGTGAAAASAMRAHTSGVPGCPEGRSVRDWLRGSSWVIDGATWNPISEQAAPYRQEFPTLDIPATHTPKLASA